MNSKVIALSGLIAAAYFVTTVMLGPLSYGPIQLRVAGLIVPIVLLDRRLALGLAVGVFLANLTSPFGIWDWGIMPIVSYLAAIAAFELRSHPPFAVFVQAAIVAIGVSVFPLGMGAKLPFMPIVLWIFMSNFILFMTGWYVIWRNFGDLYDSTGKI